MRASKTGFTFVEVLVVITLMMITGLFIMAAFSSFFMKPNAPFEARVVNKYETIRYSVSYFRVEVQRPGSSIIEVLDNNDSNYQKTEDSATIQANLLVGRTYEFTTMGTKQNGNTYPNILSFRKVD